MAYYKNTQWILSLLLLMLYGCSAHDVKERHLETDRSTYYPLAFVTSNSEIIHTGKAVDKSDNKSTGTLACGSLLTGGDVGAVFIGTLLCLPLITFDVATAAVGEAQQQKLQLNFEKQVQSLQSKLVESSSHEKLRSYALEYLARLNTDVQEVNIEISPENLEGDYHFLYEKGFPMALEITLFSVDFSEKELIREKKSVQFCLTIETQGRAISTRESEQVAVEKAIGQFCQPFDKWLSVDAIDNALSSMSRTLTEYIIGEIFLIYHLDKSKDRNAIVIQPITPEVVIDPEWRAVHKPRYRKELSTNVNTLRITDVSLQPKFEWEKLEGPNITDVKYDLAIFKGEPRVRMTTTMSGNPLKDIVSDDIYPMNKYIFPAGLVYSQSDLTEASHNLDIKLEPCSWYFWTIRARFLLAGYPRSTSWSRYWGMSFPIRTPASYNAPTCWEQAVDWGPL